MPKIKSHSSSKKRFRVTATGKVKMSNAYRRHRLVSKSKKSKTRHKSPTIAHDSDAKVIKKMIPYS